MRMLLPLACLLTLLVGCGRSAGPAKPEGLIGELPADCQPSDWNRGGADRAVAWFATNPFKGRHVEFPVYLDEVENTCSVHPRDSHTPGCLTLTIVAQPVTVFDHQFRPTLAGKRGKPWCNEPYGDFMGHQVEFHTDPATAERLLKAPKGTAALVSGTVLTSTACGFNCPKPEELFFCLSDVSVRLATDPATPAAASAP